MEIKEIGKLNSLIVEYFGYKVKTLFIDSNKKEVAFILYDSFYFKCSLDERYGGFGCGLQLSENVVSREFLGKTCSLNNDQDSIKEDLRQIGRAHV